MTAAELNHLKGDLQSARLDVARLKAALAGNSDPVSAFDPPPEAPPSLVDMHRRFLVSQTAEQNAKIAAIDRQVVQKEAERTTSKASIEKIQATLGPLQLRVDIREQLYQKELGSKLQYLTELQELVGQHQEARCKRTVRRTPPSAFSWRREQRPLPNTSAIKWTSVTGGSIFQPAWR